MMTHRILILILAIVSFVKITSATQLAVASVPAAPSIAQRCEILFIDEVSRADLQAVVSDLAKLKIRVASIDQNQPTYSALQADLVSRRHQFFASAKEVGLSRKLVHNLLADAISKEAKTNSRDQENDADKEAQRKKIRAEQERTVRDFIIDGTRVILNRIEPGTFKMGHVGRQVDVTLTQAFDMMATSTTQIIWKTVAELANARFGDKYKINADPSYFQGDTRPVEQVSYEDVQGWINGLNELSQSGEPALANLIVDHKKGDVYRLPTDAEWEFVVRGRGQNNDTYHFGSDPTKLDAYAWHEGNSELESHPVAKKLPLEFDGLEFYDLIGNVNQWVHDWHRAKLPGGTDPKGPKKGTERVVRGGGWYGDPLEMHSSARFALEADASSNDVGFRLVRTVK